MGQRVRWITGARQPFWVIGYPDQFHWACCKGTCQSKTNRSGRKKDCHRGIDSIRDTASAICPQTANLSPLFLLSYCFDLELLYIVDMMMFNDFPLARTWKLRTIHLVSPKATEWKVLLRVPERFLLHGACCSFWSPLCWKHFFSD